VLVSEVCACAVTVTAQIMHQIMHHGAESLGEGGLGSCNTLRLRASALELQCGRHATLIKVALAT